MQNKSIDKRVLYPVLMGFFIMGFCDIIAPISGVVARDFPSHQGAVSFLPSMVFLWFLLLSVPISMLMSRIGRKAVTIAGYVFTAVGMLIPFLAGRDCHLAYYFVGFALLGIGNTAIQVAVNPLLAVIVPADKMTSYLTTGQIFRNMSIMLVAPIVTLLTAATGSWRLLLAIYAALTVAGGVWLQATHIGGSDRGDRAAGLKECFGVLRNRTVAICTAGISCFIAADVSIGYLSSQLIANDNSILTSTGFYACRIVGTILGAYLLTRISDVKYMRYNMLVALVVVIELLVAKNSVVIFLLMGIFGFTMACVFATLYAAATKALPAKTDAVAGLMIMAISAGAIAAPVTSALIKLCGGTHYGVLFVVPCLGYLTWAAIALEKRNKNK